MDSKTFTACLAQRTGESPQTIDRLIASMSTILRDHAGALDSILIPGFGNFVAQRKAECIVDNIRTGARTLVPPQITVDFVASAMLKYRVSNE